MSTSTLVTFTDREFSNQFIVKMGSINDPTPAKSGVIVDFTNLAGTTIFKVRLNWAEAKEFVTALSRTCSLYIENIPVV